MKPTHLKGDSGSSNNNFHCKDAPEREATKRLAQHGQWRTPPLPAFAACNYAATPAAAASNLPTTPDEYTRMLQEAYKRGAEAGARAQQPMKHTKGRTVMPPFPTVQHMVCPSGAVNEAPKGGTPKELSPQVSSPSVIVTSVPSNSSGEPVNKRPVSVSHSKSMPDMSSYQASLAQHANGEEEKRKKRLARNRASARLRRLKKKNLVDSYEGEVGILETALSKLRTHRWGSDNIDHELLIEALSMERGQQPLTPEKRRDLVEVIMTQQREQVTNLLECQLENWILCTLVEPNDNIIAREIYSSSHKMVAAESYHEEDLTCATSDLKSVLHLTSQQLSLIEQSTLGCVHEVQDLFTVDNCLQSIHANQWLLDEGVEEVAGQFTSILNQAQLSKFLSWSDHNAEPIEKLDYVNVLARVGSGPVFEFGVDEGLADGD